MSDEELYLEATNEVEGEKNDPALLTKVMALPEVDRVKVKYQYIKLRVEQLAKNKAEEKPTFTKIIVDEFHLKYMPIAEFSKIKSVPEKIIIEMIRDGFYVGQIKDNEWYVSRDEVGRYDNIKRPKYTSQQSINSKEQEYIPV